MIKKIVVSIVMVVLASNLTANDFSMLADAVEYLIKQNDEQAMKIEKLQSTIKAMQDAQKNQKKLNPCDCPKFKSLENQIAKNSMDIGNLKEATQNNTKSIGDLMSRDAMPVVQESKPVVKQKEILHNESNILKEQRKRLQDYIESRKHVDVPSVK